MKRIAVRTSSKDQVLDLTDRVEAELPRTGTGAVLVIAAHTTCALTTADLDPGTDQDYIDAFRHLLPNLQYRHPHDPAHTPDHILASLIGPSVMVPFSQGKLVLGTWQRIVLVEFDGPRERVVSLVFLSENG